MRLIQHARSARPTTVTPLRGRGRRYLAIISERRRLSNENGNVKIDPNLRGAIAPQLTSLCGNAYGRTSCPCIPLLHGTHVPVACIELEQPRLQN